jgi:hypothetical protein
VSEENEIRPSDRRLAEAIGYFKSPNPLATAKQVFKKGHDLWIFVELEHKLDEAVALAHDEYWVLIYYTGYRKHFWPIAPDWITDELADEWRCEWFLKNVEIQPDQEWKDNPALYLQREIISYEDLATRKVFTFQATKELKTTRLRISGSYSKPESSDPSPKGYETTYTGTRESLERNELWQNRNREIEVKSEFPEGMNEQKAGLAQNAHDLLKTAYETLTEEPWEASSKELTESQAKALAHAFRAGREAEKFGSYDNIAIAKGGYPIFIKQFTKGESRKPRNKSGWELEVQKIEKHADSNPRSVFDILFESGWILKHPKMEKYKFTKDKKFVFRKSIEQRIRRRLPNS